MKSMNNDQARRVRVRAVVAYPAAAVAVVVCAAVTFSSQPVMALALTHSPTATSATCPTPTTPSPTATALSPTATTPSPTATAAPCATATTPFATATSAPGVTPSITKPTSFTFGTTTSTSSTRAVPTPVANASTSAATTGGLLVDHHAWAQVDGTSLQVRYLPVDAAFAGASQFQTLRVRFKIHNAAAVPMAVAPQLEYRPEGSTRYIVVPEKSIDGVPFRVDREWVPGGAPQGGTKQGPLGEDISVATFLTGNEGAGLAMIGHHSMGANPDQAITLPSDSYTEQEFTVLLTMDAKYLTTYEFRITNGHTLLGGTQVATIRLGAAPVLTLSPGQHQGLAVEPPKPASATGVVK